MTDEAYLSQLKKYAERIEDSLKIAIPPVYEAAQSVSNAMAYSLLGGGKRIRPVLVLAFCKALGGDWEKALPVAAAVEFIHTYSLIHDDLPCMDDDDLRRGRPTCHKAFDEATALLAGDGLLTEAFGLVAQCTTHGISAQALVSITALMAEYAGIRGMIGGQTADIAFEQVKPTDTQLMQMYGMKTGGLIKLACQCGCILGGANAHQIKLAGEYGEKLGLAFQLIDDILDIEGDTVLLGKPVGSDEKNHKPTLAVVWGLEKTKAVSDTLTLEAQSLLGSFPHNAFLLALTKALLNRTN